MAHVEVTDLKNIQNGSVVYTCSPREAVIAAYAQSLNDWNTWQYEERYGSLVEAGEHTVICGSFCALTCCPFCGKEHDSLITSCNGRTKGCQECISKFDAERAYLFMEEPQ